MCKLECKKNTFSQSMALVAIGLLLIGPGKFWVTFRVSYGLFVWVCWVLTGFPVGAVLSGGKTQQKRGPDFSFYCFLMIAWG